MVCTCSKDFYNQINLLYGSITEFCSPQSCPEMKATEEYVLLLHMQIFERFLKDNRFEYLWQDSENYKRPTKMSAPEYIEHLMSWVQSSIDNEQMFPSRTGAIPSSISFNSWKS
jgi:MOB kinase activator 1